MTAPLPIVGPFEYPALIWTALLGFIIWGDLPSSTMSMGAGIIVGAGLLIAWREAVRGASVRRSLGDKATEQSAADQAEC